MTRPKESEREDIHQLVLEKSRKLFLKYGYENVTMRKIAESIGYSAAAIYLYFDNKDEVLFELHNEGFRQLYEKQKSVMNNPSLNAFQKLHEHARQYIRFGLENPEYYNLMFMMDEPRDYLRWCEEKSNGQRTDFGELAYQMLQKNIHECKEAGYFKSSIEEVAVFTCWAFVHGTVALVIKKWMAKLPEEQLEQFIEGSIDHYIRMAEKTA